MDRTPLPSLTCKICAPGSYAPTLGQACVTCPPDTFSSGYTALGQCTACPSPQTGLAGSTSASACQCPLGMQKVRSASPRIGMQLRLTTDKQGLDNACIGCSTSTYSVNGTCKACPANSLATTGAVASSSCRCLTGYSWSDSQCRPCPVGTYWAGASAPCTPCPSGSTTADVGSRSVGFCGASLSLCLTGYVYVSGQGCAPQESL